MSVTMRFYGDATLPAERAPDERKDRKTAPLTDTLPAFAAELQRLLTEAGEPQLAAQVPDLSILGRCDCGDDFCATFYTRPKPKGGFGPNHCCMRLFPEEGSHLVLDVVDGEIACVELLDCEGVRQKLQEALP